MHVGFSPVFMNPSGAMSDLDCFKHELALADLAEPLGFDSIWQPEHHFSGYEMTPNVLQFLTYMAGRTKTVRLGSMVVVLPWHNPLRVVEDVTLLDHYSGGRTIMGIGRGLGAMEFGGLGIEMSDTRDVFVEKAETVVNATGLSLKARSRPRHLRWQETLHRVLQKPWPKFGRAAGMRSRRNLQSSLRGNASFNVTLDIRLIIA